MHYLVITSALLAVANAIYDGKDASIEDFPYHAVLEYNGRNWCQAAILNERWIVTYGLYCASKPADELKVRAGSSRRLVGGSVHEVERIVRHGGDNKTFLNDIALMQVKEPFELDDTRKPIPLFEGDLATGQRANLTGFGLVRDNRYPDNMQVVQVPVLDFDLCKKPYERWFGSALPSGLLCGGNVDVSGENACYGDEGAPFVVSGQLAGFVSYVHQCSGPNNPVLFVDVGHYRDWIDQQLEPEASTEASTTAAPLLIVN